MTHKATKKTALIINVAIIYKEVDETHEARSISRSSSTLYLGVAFAL